MDTSVSADIVQFGNFRLDRRGHRLLRREGSGAFVPIPVGSRALELLRVLVDHAGEVVTKQTIMDAVWPGTAVEESNLTVQLSTLRRVLDAGRADGSCIQTVPGRGYRFADPVTISVLSAQRPLACSAQDRRRSVIVLPFENSSGDPAQDAIAAAITRDVTSLMAGDREMLLVPAVTAAGYRGRTLDLHEIGRDHDVHFALTGDARRRDGRLLTAATLYDADDVRPVWSWRFDRPYGPMEQDAIVHGIYRTVWQSTIDWEAARAMSEHPDSLDKRDLVLAALATPLAQPTHANSLAKIALLDRALALDPNYFWALEYSARFRANGVIDGFSSDPASELAIAAKAADQMLSIDPNSVLSLRAKVQVLAAQGNWDEAAAVSRRVIALQPLGGNRRSWLGYVLMAQGHHEEALESFLTAKQLAGGADPVYFIDTNIALELLANDRFSEAIAQARLAIGEFPPDAGRGGEARGWR